MTLRHLRIFKTICELGSITAAAEKLNLSQPAVSIAVRELETFYNTKLFERRNRRIYLTETGETLRHYADMILGQFEESVDVLRNDQVSRTCRIGVNVTCAETRLAEWVRRIKAETEGLTLNIHVGNSKEIGKMLLANEIDIAVVDQIPGQKSLESRFLYSEKMSVVCSPELYEGEMTLARLLERPLLLRERGSGARNSVEAAFYSRGLLPVPCVESVSTLSLIRMAKSGLGYAILPEEAVGEELASGALQEVRIADGSFERSYYLVRHRSKHLTGSMKKVMSVLEAQAV